MILVTTKTKELILSVSLFILTNRQATAVEWRYTETGEEVRVSLQTGRIIPLPEGAKMEDDLVIPDQYVGKYSVSNTHSWS